MQHADLCLHLPDGTPIRLRAPRPDDAPAFGRLVAALTPEDRRRRFHGAVRELSTALLARMVTPPDDGTVAWIAQSSDGTLLADARAVRDETGRDAEFALMVASGWQSRGLGRLLLQALHGGAAARGWRWLYGHVLADNRAMLTLAARCGFQPTRHRDDAGIVVVEARLAPA